MQKALVTLLSGVPTDQVILGNSDDLEQLGRKFVEEQGDNACYAVCDIDFVVSDCRICQAAQATGPDELCDGCRSATS